jgi:hypothetical protein
MKYLFTQLLILLVLGWGTAQDSAKGKVTIKGQTYDYIIDANGDTLIMAGLGEVSITSLRSFESEEDYKKYRKYRRYAYSVYPYAVEAVRIFKEVEAVTNDVRKNQKRKYIKTLQEDLSEKFEEPLKKLTKTQGMILIKMIERELDVPMYDLVRDLRGGWTATYWSVLGSFYGHHLKEGYTRGKDPMLDVVLDDLNLTYGQKKQ